MELKVAAIQLPHVNYDVTGNLQRAVAAVEQAASQGAQLVLLPEFFSCGYLFDPELWEMAEVLEDGPTLTAMMEVSRRCNVMIGFTILEAWIHNNHTDDNAKTTNLTTRKTEIETDFYNTFVLVEPSGTKQVCRKSEPAAFEAWVFRGDDSWSPILETSLGIHVGVNICYENMLVSQQQRLVGTNQSENNTTARIPFDLLLCPHSAPTTNVCRSFPQDKVDLFNAIVRETPQRMAQLFGVPVILSNKVGPLHSRNPWPWIMIPRHHTFRGWSSIWDCHHGETRLVAAASSATNPQHNNDAQDETEIVMATVHLDDNKKKSIAQVQQQLQELQQQSTRYLVTLPFPLPFVWTYLMEPMGRWSYARSHAKRRAAVLRAYQRGSQPSTYKPPPKKDGKVYNSKILLGMGVAALSGLLLYNQKNSKYD